METHTENESDRISIKEEPMDDRDPAFDDGIDLTQYLQVHYEILHPESKKKKTW